MSFDALTVRESIDGLAIKNKIVVPPFSTNYTHRDRMMQRSIDCNVSKMLHH